MKKTDKITYRQKETKELQKMLGELRKKYVETKSKHATGNLKDTSVFKKMNYEIAFISTLIKEKEIETNND